ncbi:MAG: hypothetical protein KAK00_03270 [Nanoarchaeota archaeon]|nr:hypothetical protein [Nanoarchaeota archaeon]
MDESGDLGKFGSKYFTIAKKLKIPLCTHDKKLRGDFSNHEDKVAFYPKVYKPQEIIKPKK